MSMEYKYKSIRVEIFNYDSDKVRFYAGPEWGNDPNVDYESPREDAKSIENMFLKDSIYILTPNITRQL